MGKKKGNSKDAWLDWLRDDPPALDAKDELRERFKRQANSYQPVNRSRLQPPQQPTIHQPNVAAPQQPVQASEVPKAASAQKQSSAGPLMPKSTAPATVSIQINIPSFHSERVQKAIRQIKRGIGNAKTWFNHQLHTNKRQTIGIGAGLAVLILLLFVPPLFNFGYGKDRTETGGTSGTSAGSAAKYEKPPFEVVRPSGKPKLGTPDGVHAAYDGSKNSYSYNDSIGNNGFTVSQQPLPPQFSDGQSAIDAIAPTLNKGVTPVTLKVLTGSAAVSTNPKYNSQTVVATVRDLLIFIQSSHAFKNSEWENYINTLQ